MATQLDEIFHALDWTYQNTLPLVVVCLNVPPRLFPIARSYCLADSAVAYLVDRLLEFKLGYRDDGLVAKVLRRFYDRESTELLLYRLKTIRIYEKNYAPDALDRYEDDAVDFDWIIPEVNGIIVSLHQQVLRDCPWPSVIAILDDQPQDNALLLYLVSEGKCWGSFDDECFRFGQIILQRWCSGLFPNSWAMSAYARNCLQEDKSLLRVVLNACLPSAVRYLDEDKCYAYTFCGDDVPVAVKALIVWWCTGCSRLTAQSTFLQYWHHLWVSEISDNESDDLICQLASMLLTKQNSVFQNEATRQLWQCFDFFSTREEMGFGDEGWHTVHFLFHLQHCITGILQRITDAGTTNCPFSPCPRLEQGEPLIKP